MVYKLAPYYPAAVGFGNDDAAFLARIGFNAVRVGVIWKARRASAGGLRRRLPVAHRADGSDARAPWNRVAARLPPGHVQRAVPGRGVPRLVGAGRRAAAGAASWASAGNYFGDAGAAARARPLLGEQPGPRRSGAPGPLRGRLAARCAAVPLEPRRARLRADERAVPRDRVAAVRATDWLPDVRFDVACVLPARRYARSARSIAGRSIWYEPNVAVQLRLQTRTLGPLGDPRAGFSFHDYCFEFEADGSMNSCASLGDLVVANALKHVQQNGDALLMSEFGDPELRADGGDGAARRPQHDPLAGVVVLRRATTPPAPASKQRLRREPRAPADRLEPQPPRTADPRRALPAGGVGHAAVMELRPPDAHAQLPILHHPRVRPGAFWGGHVHRGRDAGLRVRRQVRGCRLRRLDRLGSRSRSPAHQRMPRGADGGGDGQAV